MNYTRAHTKILIKITKGYLQKKIEKKMFVPPAKRILCFLSAHKKYFFQKSTLIYTRIGLKIPTKYFRNKKRATLCTLRARFT